MKKTMNLSLSSKSFEQAIKELRNLKKQVDKNVNNSFLKSSAKQIRDDANNNLKGKTSFENTTNILDAWDISKIVNNTIRLENKGVNLENLEPVSAYVEFGTGIIGESDSSSREIASKAGYSYNWSSPYKDSLGGWTFITSDGKGDKILFEGFMGYEGKNFLYNAYLDYKQGGYEKLYEVALIKYLKGWFND